MRASISTTGADQLLLLDVNVLIATFRDDHPHHTVARPWFNEMAKSGEPFTVPQYVWSAVFRIVTNPRIFEVPAPRDEAFDFADSICAQAGYLQVRPDFRHLSLLRGMCEEGDAVGDLIPDATIAAIALEFGCTVVTFDRDFARFPSIRHIRPGA